MSQGPRSRLIGAAIELVREKGVEGTGLAELLERGCTARRSLYQHFPGGKHELIEASTLAAGRFIESGIRGAEGATVAGSVADFLDASIANATATDFRLGCPVGAAALAPADAAIVIGAAGTTFASWSAALAEHLVREGHAPDAAASLAGFVVSSYEGALLRARAARSTEPLEQAKQHLLPLLTAPDRR
ncbi:TetR/AcrR family transcriptional regulator [Nocardioides jiangxiensis]|uniref:TetR/AcrR family transcriptional regulator n=1 Tax=Nocardioides jiangxiensis TaxID=3064524 RepID=A0ABT9B0Y2_9ACTN|nr:TetR/AcrR family transcriptional regulator [Nocardioides sp. WY-20]MDO7867974.1 TetR/AcrR family transcriptional regulator [Nocardioides sp. WY-20]